MDDQKNQNTQTSQGNQSDQANAQIQVDQNTPKVVPVGGQKLKEQGPNAFTQGKQVDSGISMAESDQVAKEEGDEYWENYAREIELEKEIAEIGGVEKVESGEVKVDEKLAKEMGVKPTVNVQTPITNVTSFSIRGVSMTDDQLALGQKKPTSSGIRWLVEWFIYQLLKAHYHIKRIGEKILRQQSK